VPEPPPRGDSTGGDTALTVARGYSGSTFTDLVGFDAEAGQIKIAKALTTPRHPETRVLDAVRAGQLALEEAEAFVHGTTVVVNAITERKGARTVPLTTALLGAVELRGPRPRCGERFGLSRGATASVLRRRLQAVMRPSGV
jgi:hypothetical protein